MLDRLDQMVRHAQRAAPGRVAGPPIRRQHQDRGAGDAVARLQLADQGEAVHARHVHVDQQDVEALAVVAGGLNSRSAASPSDAIVTSTFQPRSTSARMRRLVSLSSTTSARQPATRSAAAASASPGERARIGDGQSQREAERAALARRALDADRAAHQPDDAVRDGQAEAGAAEAPRRRAVLLGERLEDEGLLVGGDADAGVVDGEAQRAPVRVDGRRRASRRR